MDVNLFGRECKLGISGEIGAPELNIMLEGMGEEDVLSGTFNFEELKRAIKAFEAD